MSHYRSECAGCGEYAYLDDDGLCGPEINDCASRAHIHAWMDSYIEALDEANERLVSA
jgi:hypothetical protein